MKILLVTGCAAILLGSLDPLEGSVLIVIGSALVTLRSFLDPAAFPTRKYWVTALLLNVVGVIALFVLSAFGGVGGENGHSWWWALFVLPYPVGWVMALAWIIGAMRRGTKQWWQTRRVRRP